MTLRQVALLLVLAVTPSIPRWSGACEPALRDGGTWEARPTAGDTQGPTQVTATSTIERHGESHSPLGCGTTCGQGFAYIVLQLSAVDDIATPDTIGYRFAIASGQPPEIYDALSETKLVDPYSEGGREIGLRFDINAAPFTFDLEVVAVDGNGNESAPVVVEISG